VFLTMTAVLFSNVPLAGDVVDDSVAVPQ